MVQNIVQVGKECMDLLKREGEGKENVWRGIELAGIHSPLDGF